MAGSGEVWRDTNDQKVAGVKLKRTVDRLRREAIVREMEQGRGLQHQLRQEFLDRDSRRK